MGTTGPSGGFDINNLFKNTPQPQYNPSAPNSAGGSYNTPNPFPNFPVNNMVPPGSYGSSASPLQGSHPYMPIQGPPNQQYPPYLPDLAMLSSHYQSHGLPQPSPSHSPSPSPSPSPSMQPFIPPSASFNPVNKLSRPSSPSLDGARLMQLLNYQSTGGLVDPAPRDLPSISHGNSLKLEIAPPPAAVAPAVPSAPPMSLAPNSASGRKNKNLPKGRYLQGEHVVYDIDVRQPGEAQPQLEASPITMYASDPVLLVGRQIAVNRSYICYGLRPNRHIRILNSNTASRNLLRGHSERVTDMAFFAEDVHLLASASSDGRVFVRRILEGPGEDSKLQITDQIVLALQFTGNWQSIHPRVCWLSHTQDYLLVGVSKSVFLVDLLKVKETSAPNGFSTDEPIFCPVDNPIEGVECIVKHDSEVTDLSASPWAVMASASNDGTVRLWKDKPTHTLSIFAPYEGKPVHAVAFLTPLHHPDHIVVLSAGPSNRELKLWVPATQDGWFPPSGPVKFKCTQTLELKSSTVSRPEDAFFNQVLMVPKANVILLANAKRSALYVVHVAFGPNPSATRMDYISEFSVVMPILSFTASCDNVFDGNGVVQIYCVQTQSIQQYSLDLGQCLPPIGEPPLLTVDKDSVYGVQGLDSSSVNKTVTKETTSALEVSSILRAKSPGPISGVTLSSDSLPAGNVPVLHSTSDFDSSETRIKESIPDFPGVSAPAPQIGQSLLSPRSSPLTKGRGDENPLEHGSAATQESTNEQIHPYEQVPKLSTDTRIGSSIPSSPSKRSHDPISVSPRPHYSEELPAGSSLSSHLVTPSELMSLVARTRLEAGGSSISSPRDDSKPRELLKPVVETEKSEKSVNKTSIAEAKEMTQSNNFPQNEAAPSIDLHSVETSSVYDTSQTDTTVKVLEQTLNVEVAEIRDDNETIEERDPSIKPHGDESTDKYKEGGNAPVTVAASQARKKKNKNKTESNVTSSIPMPSALPSISSTSEHDSSSNIRSYTTMDMASQISTVQDSLNKLVAMQKEFQQQMGGILAVPIAKEVKRMEAVLGQRMEKVLKSHMDALWARLQEENAKRERIERERMQQLSALLSSSMSKELPSAVERAVKKELSSLGPTVARIITPSIEKTISTTVSDAFQKGINEKGIAQLEKSVSTKIEASLSKQLHAQFQISGKPALQEALRTSLESSVIPTFERACQVMFEQVDSALQKSISENQAQLATSHTALASSLQDAVASATNLAASLKGELAEGQRRLVAVLENSRISRGPVMINGSLPEKAMTVQHIEETMDPTKELTRLVSERKLEEAFNKALSLSNVAVVSWLCNQVDLAKLLTMTPPPLSQGVILALVQQLGCDLANDTGKKLMWIKDAALALNPHDPGLPPHVMRHFLEKLYANLHALLTTSLSSELVQTTRLVIHVVNSLLTACK